MNRYVTAGIAADARAGRRVLVLVGHELERRLCFEEVARLVHADVASTVGREQIRFAHGGSVHFLRSLTSTHGRSADVVFVDHVFATRALDRGIDLAEQLAPCVQSTGGEIIRA